MLKTLKDHFSEQASFKLDKNSKADIFLKINKKRHYTFWINRAFMVRSKVLSVVLVIAFSFSILQYLYLPNQGIFSILGRLRSSDMASADYIATVVSWDWSYQINLKNWSVVSKGSASTISDGSELIVEKWSKVTIKTSNQAQADVVWPAKIAFNKKDNQIIVDVKYSEKIDIKQEKQENQFNDSSHTANSESRVAKERDLLVVKTKNQTIVGKQWDSLHIALVHETITDSDTITNKDGDIVITNAATNTIVELKTNQVATILDMEVRLFASVDSPQDKTDEKVSLLAKNDKVAEAGISNTQKLDIQSDLKDLLGSKETDSNKGITTTDDKDLKESVDDSISMTMLADLSRSAKYDEATQISADSGVALVGETVTEDEKATLAMVNTKENDLLSQPLDVDAKTDSLLGSKKVLSSSVVLLLDKLYKNYQNDPTKNITNHKDIIVQLCNLLHVSCKKWDDTVSCMYDLRIINNKIKNSYIVTSEIKFVR